MTEQIALLITALVIASLSVWIKLINMRYECVVRESVDIRAALERAATENRNLQSHVHWLCTAGGVAVEMRDMPVDDYVPIHVMIRADRRASYNDTQLADLIRDGVADLLDTRQVMRQPEDRRGIYTTADPPVGSPPEWQVPPIESSEPYDPVTAEDRRNAMIAHVTSILDGTIPNTARTRRAIAHALRPSAPPVSLSPPARGTSRERVVEL